MLTKLTIENFVIAEHLEIHFQSGLCTLTGETGAGKSLIVDAILGVLGQRISPDTIRAGAEFAYLEASFVPSAAIRELLRQRAHEELVDAELLVLSKTVHPSGSRSRLNGQLITQALVRELASQLVDSLGQHENQALFNEDQHLGMLDELGDSAHQHLLQEVAQCFSQLQQQRRELQQQIAQQREQERQKDFLSFQLQEIQEAGLEVGEEEQLQAERERLRHAEKLLSAVGEAYVGLYDNPHGSTVCEQIEGLQRTLASALRFDAGLEPITEQLESALIQLQEAAHGLSRYQEDIDRDPARLESLEARLDQIKRLRHKYGADAAEILAYAEGLSGQLADLQSSSERLEALEQSLQQLEQRYGEAASLLSRRRAALAKWLEPRIEGELRDLGMNKTRFVVELNPDSSRSGDTGQDQVRFLLSPNPGEPLRPLARIASGGEASRLLLAFKLVLKRSHPVPTLIFDEVDTGISGKAALVVSQKLASLAGSHQLLCITHLPVIAAMADQQLWIEKQMGRDQTRIRITPLQPEQRLERLAQMGSGQINDATLEGAREIYASAQAYKTLLGRELSEAPPAPVAKPLPVAS